MLNPSTSREISRRAWAIFWIGSLGFLLSMFYRLSITVISPELTRDLNLNTVQLSQLSAAFFYAFALSQIPIGMALDSIGPRTVVTVLNGAGLAGAVFFASAQTVGQAYWARILIGVGMSGNLMGMLTLLAAWFPAHRFASIGGLFVGIGSAGSMLAATPLALLARAFGWRGSFLLIASINALQVLAFLVFVRDRPPEKDRSKTFGANPLKGLWLVLKFPSYWWISIGAFFRYGCLTALQGLWAGPYLINGLGFSTLEAGNALFFMGLSYMVGLPLSGRFSDRIARTRKWVILPSLFITALLFLSLMVWSRGAPVMGLYLVFFALGFFTAPGQIMYSHIKELVPPQVMSTAMTGINLFTMLGAAFIMEAMGLVVAAGPQGLSGPEGFGPAWILCAAGLGLSGFLYLLVPDSPLSRRKEGLSRR
jgi:predicted MFS family arabinose efflux permease